MCKKPCAILDYLTAITPINDSQYDPFFRQAQAFPCCFRRGRQKNYFNNHLSDNAVHHPVLSTHINTKPRTARVSATIINLVFADFPVIIKTNFGGHLFFYFNVRQMRRADRLFPCVEICRDKIPNKRYVMSILPDTIVYIWLLPVVAQIILPLGMLLVWLASKPIRQVILGQTGDTSPAAHLPRAAAKKSA